MPVPAYTRLTLLVVLVLLLSGCQFAGGETATPAPPPPTSLPPASSVVRAAGIIQPARKARLAVTGAGRVETLAVAVGDRVEDGELLLVLERSAAEAALAQAQAGLAGAQAALAELRTGPQPAQIAAAQARRDAAQAHLDQLTLDRLLTPATPSQLAEARALVRSAQAELDLLQAPVTEATIARAEAAVAQAEAGVQASLGALAAGELRAPFAGTVTGIQVSEGEMAVAGQPLVTLADLSRLQVETTDFSERDLGRVAVGAPVVLFVEALDRELTGRVERIALQATLAGGDVVYPVTIALNEQPPELRWGMSVDVEVR